MRLSAIIVDDEVNSRAVLNNYLKKYCPSIEVLAEAASVKETLLLLENHEPDVLFLDVEMPYGNAFDLLEQLPDRSFETIFVTAYDHYAIDALNSQASYYLLKPIAIDDLIHAVDQVSKVKEREEALQNQILTPVQSIVASGKITIPKQDGFEVLEVAEILYCQADDNYTKIFLKQGQRLVSKTLKHFETILSDQGFVRIHKSYLVHLNAIVQYKKGKGGSVVLSSGKELQVSPTKKSALLDYFS